jgi:hypothetical protein
MATIYVMTDEKKHSYNDVLHGLLNHEAYFLNYIQSNQFEEEDLMGLKLFLEHTNYDVDALQKFTAVHPLQTSSKKTKVNLIYYKIAASLILLFGISYFVYTNSNKTHSLESFMIEDAGFKVWMSSSSSRVDLQNGMNYYRSENYTEALPYFSKLPKNDTALYYSGISSIHLNRLSDAELCFNKIPHESIYKNRSFYYKSLCYIFNHKETEGLQILNRTTFTDSIFIIKKNELLNAYDQH